MDMRKMPGRVDARRRNAHLHSGVTVLEGQEVSSQILSLKYMIQSVNE